MKNLLKKQQINREHIKSQMGGRLGFNSTTSKLSSENNYGELKSMSLFGTTSQKNDNCK